VENTTNKPQDVSFDLETLGTKPEALILSIGAAKFDRDTGVISDEFYRVIDIEAPGGGVIDASTVAWWMRQNQEARDAVFGEGVERVPLAHALVDFAEWLGFNDDLPADQPYPNVHLWQRGDKDALWLTSAYEGTGLKVPFPYWAVSDQRTLCRWVPCREVPRAGVYHNALSDAIHQAAYIYEAFQTLTNIKRTVWVERDSDGLRVRCENDVGRAAVYVDPVGLAHEVFAAEVARDA
jgi:hypothetical protein